jgi:putative Holliday junction resolvase
VGSVRVGLATCDPEGVLASPVATLPRDVDGRADQHEIERYVREHDVVEVVVGLPLSLSGEHGPAAALARDYALALHRLLRDTPIRLVDERLTTVDAQRQMRGSGVAGRRQRARIDQAAAVLILQAALDSERATGQPAGVLVGGRKPRARRARADNEGQR